MKKKILVLGLTGSVGMGKSTTAEMFRDEGVPVWDADEAVARAYSPGGAAVAQIKKLCPSAVPDHSLGVDRKALRASVEAGRIQLDDLESIVHPVVADDRNNFLAESRARNERMVVLDVPLLYEVQAERSVDAVIVVTVSKNVQRQRVLARENMTEDLFERILARQIPDEEKKARADFIIDTSDTESARESVRLLIERLEECRDK